MAAEAETSASHNAAHSFQHHLQLHRPHIFYPADITSSNPHNEKRSSQRHSDNNSMDKLISVDEFDDSDDEDIRSCSTVSPTPSDNTINGNYSGPYSSVGGSSNSNHKLRKRGVVPSKVLDETELQSLRLKINSRERKRMHDLNSALDGLREVMPYAHGPSVRKLSKIATLLLARNYILTLNSSLEEMKKLVNDIYHNPGTTSRRVSSQMTQRSSIPTSVAVSSSGNVAETSKNSENSASNLHCKSTQPTSKASEPLSVFAHPSTNHMSPLSAQPPVQPLLPLSIPALRASLSGLTPHDINALVSACTLPKCDGGSTPAVPQTFPGQVHLLSSLPAPCACAQCLSGASHFPPSLQLGRFCHPLFTSSAFLHRKN